MPHEAGATSAETNTHAVPTAGIMGELVSGRADIAAFPLSLTLPRPTAADLSYSYINGGIGILVQICSRSARLLQSKIMQSMGGIINIADVKNADFLVPGCAARSTPGIHLREDVKVDV